MVLSIDNECNENNICSPEIFFFGERSNIVATFNLAHNGSKEKGQEGGEEVHQKGLEEEGQQKEARLSEFFPNPAASPRRGFGLGDGRV